MDCWLYRDKIRFSPLWTERLQCGGITVLILRGRIIKSAGVHWSGRWVYPIISWMKFGLVTGSWPKSCQIRRLEWWWSGGLTCHQPVSGAVNAWCNRGPWNKDWTKHGSINWWNTDMIMAISQLRRVSVNLSTWIDGSMVTFGDLNGDKRADYIYVSKRDSSSQAWINTCGGYSFSLSLSFLVILFSPPFTFFYIFGSLIKTGFLRPSISFKSYRNSKSLKYWRGICVEVKGLLHKTSLSPEVKT